MFYKILGAYLAVINLIGVILVISDKSRSQKGKWRIRERTFFIVSLLGGGIGTYISMLIIRHKTKHPSFMIGIPLIIIAEILAAAALIYFL